MPPGPALEIPGYRLVELIGQGGMGQVHRAIDPTGRSVALKILSCDRMTPRALARFEREAELLARHRHPGVVAAHAWGRTPSACWLACELVEGRHVDVAARQLGLEARLDLAIEVARAVGGAHAMGVVHRDLKPSNLLVDREGRVKVIDFGVSTAMGVVPITHTGQFVGTPLYAPPERLFQDGDPKADSPAGDVWSLGAIAYELITGVHPYPYAHAAELIQRHAPPSSPRELEPELPRPVCQVLLEALSPLPADRPRDANALVLRLEEARAARDGGGRRTGALVLVALILLAAGAAAFLRRDPSASAQLEPASGGVDTAVTTAAAEDLEVWAAALAEAGRWGELRILLAGQDRLGAGPRRLRGLAALFVGDLAAARRDLDPGEPLIVLEAHLARLAAIEPGSETEDGLLGEMVSLVDAARRLPRGQAGTREGLRRAQAGVSRGLLRLGCIPLGSTLGEAQLEGLLAAASPLADGPERPRLELARSWVAYGRSVHRREWIVARRSSLPTLEGIEEQPAPFPAILGALHLVGATFDPARTTLPARPLVELVARTLHDLDSLGVAGPAHPGHHLQRLALRALAGVERDAACQAFRAGDRARGVAHISSAQEHLVRLSERTLDDPSDSELALMFTIPLVAGDVPAAREAARRWRRRPGHERLLQAECDLVEGELARAAKRLHRVNSAAASLDRLQSRLEVHRQVLAGELSAAEALDRRMPPDHPAEAELGLEWHSARGFQAVLQGGWWPGRR